MGSPVIFNGPFAQVLPKTLRLGALSSDPANGQAGDVYYNTTIGNLKYYNGSGWVTSGTVSGGIITDWVNAGATQIIGTTTNPTKGTVTNDKFWYRRVGGNMEFRMEYTQTAVGTAGSGDYVFQIPTSLGLSIDTAKITANNTFNAGAAANGGSSCGGGFLAYLGAGLADVEVLPYDSTGFRLGFVASPNAGAYVGAAGGYALTFANNANILLYGSVPIVGWTATAPTAVGTWSSYTPTFVGLGTTTVKTAIWRQIGQNYECRITVTAGTTTSSVASVSLPNGGTSSSSLLASNPAGAGTSEAVGRISHSGSTLVSVANVLCAPSATVVNIGIQTATSNGLTPATGIASVTTGETITLLFSVPIQGL